MERWSIHLGHPMLQTIVIIVSRVTEYFIVLICSNYLVRDWCDTQFQIVNIHLWRNKSSTSLCCDWAFPDRLLLVHVFITHYPLNGVRGHFYPDRTFLVTVEYGYPGKQFRVASHGENPSPGFTPGQKAVMWFAASWHHDKKRCSTLMTHPY